MKLNEEQREKFKEACKPLMKFLCENCNPHVTVVVESTTAELLEGQMLVKTDEFVLD